MSEKIKTSEEIRAELSDKKIAKTYLSEFENGINKKLCDFKRFLVDFKPSYELKHKYDTEEIKTLNIALNEISLKLQKFTIPEKIEVLEKKETLVKFSDSTTKFLMYFCSICFVCAVVGAIYGTNAYKKIEDLKQTEFEKGILYGRNQIYTISTERNKKLINKNYPLWRTKIK